jgi:ferritin-like metal-binding protein YciE
VPDAAQAPLVNPLRDAHAIELQARRQLARAAQVSDDDIGDAYRAHLEESEQHEQRIAELLEAHDRAPSPVEDKTMRGGVIGLRQLSDITLNTPVRAAMHLFALEHLEIATYELLEKLAEAIDDEQSAKTAQEIVQQERAAAEKVEGSFDRAAELLAEKAESKRDAPSTEGSESDQGGDSSDQHRDSSAVDAVLLEHLCEVHALEQQALHLLQIATDELCEDEELQQLYAEHLEQTREHERRVSERIEAHDAKPSAVRDLHLGAASVGLRGLAAHPPDAPVKVAMNFFCFEHLEIAAYELLGRLAKRAGDDETAQLAEEIAQQEREAAEQVKGSFERSIQLMLDSDASYAGTRPLDSAQRQE